MHPTRQLTYYDHKDTLYLKTAVCKVACERKEIKKMVVVVF